MVNGALFYSVLWALKRIHFENWKYFLQHPECYSYISLSKELKNTNVSYRIIMYLLSIKQMHYLLSSNGHSLC